MNDSVGKIIGAAQKTADEIATTFRHAEASPEVLVEIARQLALINGSIMALVSVLRGIKEKRG